MEWIKVETDLPKDGEEVVLLVEGYFCTSPADLGQTLNRKIFQGSFNRRRGWYIPYINENKADVVAWMPAPKPLEPQ